MKPYSSPVNGLLSYPENQRASNRALIRQTQRVLPQPVGFLGMPNGTRLAANVVSPKPESCYPGPQVGRFRSMVVVGFCCVSVFLPQLGSAATYHVRADGTAPGKAAATGCETSGTAMSVSTQNAETFLPGDRIVLCDEGGVFRSIVNPRSSGSSSSTIIYDGRGTAIISAADIVSGWSWDGSNVYRTGVVDRPQQIFVDGSFGDRRDSRADLINNLDWYWESNTLYLFSADGNPDTVFNNPGVEAGTRVLGFNLNEQDHLIVQGVTVRHSNGSGFKGWEPGSFVTLRNCTAEWNWQIGIELSGTVPYEHIMIEDTTARYNGTGGIGFFGPGSDSVIRRNKCYENGKFQSIGNEYQPQHQWTYGIKLWEHTAGQEGNVVYFNESYNNGRGQPGDPQGRGVGIWFDMVPGNPASLNIIRHNLVYSNKGNGIFIELSSNTATYGNVLHNNASTTGGLNEFAPANIVIDAREDWIAENNLVYNNTSKGGRYGIKVVTYGQWAGCSVQNNIVKNNIAVGAGEHNLYCNFGGDNDGVHGFGNVYEYNNFGSEAADFIQWDRLSYNSYGAWEVAYGQPTFSIEGDPQLAGSTAGTLYLTAASPCIDAGADLGPPYDEGLLATSIWPNSVLTTSQYDHGYGWDAGAFPHSGDSPPILFVSTFEGGDTSEWTTVFP